MGFHDRTSLLGTYLFITHHHLPFLFYFFRAITPNGTFPGPTIKLQKGDSVNIPVHNALTDPGMRRSTSIVSFSISLPSAGLVGNY